MRLSPSLLVAGQHAGRRRGATRGRGGAEASRERSGTPSAPTHHSIERAHGGPPPHESLGGRASGCNSVRLEARAPSATFLFERADCPRSRLDLAYLRLRARWRSRVYSSWRPASVRVHDSGRASACSALAPVDANVSVSETQHGPRFPGAIEGGHCLRHNTAVLNVFAHLQPCSSILLGRHRPRRL
jgi:hypothetical protein